MSAGRSVIAASVWPGRPLTRREREVLTRCAERECERVLTRWRAEDRPANPVYPYDHALD